MQMNNNVLDFLEKTQQLYPDKIAFEDLYSKITFSQLLVQSKKIAGCILQNVIIGRPVALFMDKSVNAICALLSVVYAGGAYSFIDTKQPATRIQSIFETLSPTLVIYDLANAEKAAEVLKENGGKHLMLENIIDDAEQIIDSEEDLKQRRMAMVDTQPLYINFTSGSTGIPKGVVVSHKSVLDFIPVFTEVMGINSEDVLGNQAPFDFDVSVKDIYSGLYTGATTVLIPRDYFTQPVLLMDYLCDRRITVLIWAVSALCFLTTMKGLEYRCPSIIKCIGFSGEVMPIRHFNKLRNFLSNTRFVNLYGPTEITCNCTYYIIPQDEVYQDDDVIPIGKAFGNEKVFLLDENDTLIPPDRLNTIGEICVAGTCLALGYYGNEKRTKEVFVQNPLQDNFPDLIYRTGDLAKYNKNGDLVYTSRIDCQIKHMGHRVELGEIESTTMRIKGVDRAVCLYNSERKRIVLLYTGKCDKVEIEKQLRVMLPTYMIPNKIIYLESLPLNKNGKVDRAVLKELVK